MACSVIVKMLPVCTLRSRFKLCTTEFGLSKCSRSESNRMLRSWQKGAATAHGITDTAIVVAVAIIGSIDG